MHYDSLLLNFGGGIINDAKKSKQFTGSAALAIGIGGTGVAALSELKGKIYQQLEPDNPGDPIPRYDAIQLLAIDSDDTDYKRYRGNCRLREDEFFSITNSSLAAALKAKGLIKDNPLLNWMDIDHIDKLLAPEGAGGIRQVGRFLLINKASTLETKLQAKCSTALKARKANSIDIYIFAGISGGTGSGCFLDTCYLVRKVVERNGWNAKIMGYFFLPDVVTSKPEVASKPASVAYNNSNGYAAMKELDYLMSLKDANDWFTQNYGPSLLVHTQEPPVDMCHLISASKADGSLVPNGFSYGINVASDYAMAYLAEVEVAGADDKGMTMRGHLANVVQGVGQIPRQYGANLSYHVLGASNAEIPMTQINTYLAAGFMQRFQETISDRKGVVTKSVVMELMKDLRITAEDVFSGVTNGTPQLDMYDIDLKILKNMGVMPKRKLPDVWATCGNAWVDKSTGIMEANASSLNKPLGSFDYTKINDDALIGQLFRKLYDLCVDPNYGPYYAAALLNNSGFDLLAAMDGEIKTADENKSTQMLQADGMDSDLVELSKTYVHKANNKTYARYKDGAARWYLINNSVTQCAYTAKVLRNFKEQIKALYNDFFKPLCDMLDNLRDTFQENQNYMMQPVASEASAYTWQILTLEDIKPRLDECIKNLTVQQLVNKFISYLLEKNEAWRNNDQDKIALIIRTHMLELFKDQTSRNLQDYLFDKYPNAKGDPNLLAQEVQDNILTKVHSSAIPMFWCDPSFNMMDKGNVFENSSLSVPSLASAVCQAADQFKVSHDEYTVRKTGIGDRIFALRFCSGVPLYAYQGITLLKDSYDAAGNAASGVGSHLYALTGRGDDGSGDKDWRKFLPTPLPYSKVRKVNPNLIPEGEELVTLYDEGEACGAIGTTSTTNEYAIFMSPEFEGKTYVLADFTEDGLFMQAAYDAEYARLQNIRDHIHDEENCELFMLKNDGASAIGSGVVERVRKDYFTHYPQLQAAVRKEIEKVNAIKASLESLEAVYSEQKAYTDDLSRFCNLVFFKLITCANSLDKEDYDKIAFVYCNYKDKYQDTKRFDFSIKRKEMPYAAKFPLYQAFLTYRSLEPKKTPRVELDKAVEECISSSKKLEDAFVCAKLERIWNADAIEELREEEVKHMAVAEAKAIVRFYEGLRTNILHMRDEFPEWPTEEDLKNEGKAPVQTAAPAALTPRWVYDGAEYLTLYPDRSLSWAWSSSKNTWVPLTPAMYVQNSSNQWEQVRFDANNNIILS